jgi:hypothetical protein
MSGQLNIPLLAPEHASKLLEDVLYERVLGCVDLEALFMIELDLWVALAERDAADENDAKPIAKAMIDRALLRLPDEERRYAAIRPFGSECLNCEEEILETANRKKRSQTG